MKQSVLTLYGKQNCDTSGIYEMRSPVIYKTYSYYHYIYPHLVHAHSGQ